MRTDEKRGSTEIRLGGVVCIVRQIYADSDINAPNSQFICVCVCRLLRLSTNVNSFCFIILSQLRQCPVFMATNAVWLHRAQK